MVLFSKDMLFNNLITGISLAFLHFKTSKHISIYVGHMYFVQGEQKCLQRKFIWIFYLRLFCAVSSRRNTEYIGSDFVRLTYEAVIMQLFKMLRHHSGFSLFLDDSLRI